MRGIGINLPPVMPNQFFSRAIRSILRVSLCAVISAASARAADEPFTIALGGVAGPYSVQQWKSDWPGCEYEDGVKHGRVSLVDRERKSFLHVAFAVGEVGPEKNGAGWRYPFGKHEAAELSYTVRFSRDFDWVKGGKLPGLSGGPENVSGGKPANGTNGFSARLMWRRDGRGEAYVYHRNQKGGYGDSFPFPDDFRFSPGALYRVRERVTMNAVGERDGTLRVWIALGENPERLVVARNDMEWRTVDTFGVDSIYFETFHGGGDPTWAPTRECWAEFGEFAVIPK